MKRIIAIILAMIMVFSLVACSSNRTEKTHDNLVSSKPAIFGDSDKLEVTEGDFSYTLIYVPNSPLNVSVTKYNGTDSVVNIPSEVKGYAVTSIGESAFSYCLQLTTVTIPDSVTHIGDGAFFYDAFLRTVIMPDSVKYIGPNAFWGCKSLTKVTIPKNVISIGAKAFYNCESLTKVTIPKSVTSIGTEAFKGCSKLTTVYFKSEEQKDRFKGCFRGDALLIVQ